MCCRRGSCTYKLVERTAVWTVGLSIAEKVARIRDIGAVAVAVGVVVAGNDHALIRALRGHLGAALWTGIAHTAAYTVRVRGHAVLRGIPLYRAVKVLVKGRHAGVRCIHCGINTAGERGAAATRRCRGRARAVALPCCPGRMKSCIHLARSFRVAVHLMTARVRGIHGRMM